MSDDPTDVSHVRKLALRRGEHRQLEEAATELIRRSLEGVTAYRDKADILTPWKQADRHSREVYTRYGHPERHLRSGLYNRAANPSRPELNSRDGIAPPRLQGTLGAFVAEHGLDASDDEAYE